MFYPLMIGGRRTNPSTYGVTIVLRRINILNRQKRHTIIIISANLMYCVCILCTFYLKKKIKNNNNKKNFFLNINVNNGTFNDKTVKGI